MTGNNTTQRAILGYVIARKREAARISRAQICKEIGVSQPTWMRIEKGETAAISYEVMMKIAKSLGVEASDLYKEAEDARKKLESEGVEVLEHAPKKMSPATKIIVGGALAAVAAFIINKAKNDGDDA